MTFDREQFGRNLMFRLKQKHMSQQDLSDQSGVSRVAINRWINGNAVPSVDYLTVIAKVLNVTMDDLLKNVVKE